MAPKAKSAIKKAAQAVKTALPDTPSSKAAPAASSAPPAPPPSAPSSKAAPPPSTQPTKPTSIAIPPTTSKAPRGPKSAKVKTPADEGIEFFEGELHKGDADIRVFELKLAEDGGPTKEGAVSTHAYHLRSLPTRSVVRENSSNEVGKQRKVALAHRLTLSTPPSVCSTFDSPLPTLTLTYSDFHLSQELPPLVTEFSRATSPSTGASSKEEDGQRGSQSLVFSASSVIVVLLELIRLLFAPQTPYRLLQASPD